MKTEKYIYRHCVSLSMSSLFVFFLHHLFAGVNSTTQSRVCAKVNSKNLLERIQKKQNYVCYFSNCVRHLIVVCDNLFLVHGSYKPKSKGGRNSEVQYFSFPIFNKYFNKQRFEVWYVPIKPVKNCHFLGENF